MKWNMSSTTSENYKSKISVFETCRPEELLFSLKNFNNAIDGTGNNSTQGKINYLGTILCG